MTDQDDNDDESFNPSWNATTSTGKPLTEIESEFIREQIRRLDVYNEDHREYVAELVKLEQLALDEWKPTGLGGGWYSGMIRTKHDEEWDRIQRELAPEKYRERKQRERERKRKWEQRREQWEQEAEENARELKEQWDAVQDDTGPTQ